MGTGTRTLGKDVESRRDGVVSPTTRRGGAGLRGSTAGGLLKMTSHAPRRPWPLPRDGTLLESWRAGSNIGRVGGASQPWSVPPVPRCSQEGNAAGYVFVLSARFESRGNGLSSDKRMCFEACGWTPGWRRATPASNFEGQGVGDGSGETSMAPPSQPGTVEAWSRGAPGELQGPGHSGLGAKPPPHSKASKCWRRGHPVPGLDVFATPSEASGWCVPIGTRLPGNSRSDGGKEPDLKREVASKYPNFARLGSPTFTAHTSPFVAVCRRLSLFQSQKQTRLYEANHILLGKTPIFSGERKGKRPICSPDCMRGLAGPETVVAAFGVPWEDGKHVNVSPPRPPKTVPPPAERIFHHVAPDAVDVTVPRPVCPSQLSTNEGTEHSSGPPPRPRQSSATVVTPISGARNKASAF